MALDGTVSKVLALSENLRSLKADLYNIEETTDLKKSDKKECLRGGGALVV